MTDAATEELYGDDGGAGVRYVVRLSRTATGTRTYTVGMTLPESYAPDNPYRPDQLHNDGEAIARLFAIEDAVRMLIEAPGKPVPEVLRRAAPTARDRAVRAMSIAKPVTSTLAPNGGMSAPGINGWYTTDELATAAGVSKTQMRTVLHKLVEDGHVEVEQGGGKGRQSRYRLVGSLAPSVNLVPVS